MGAVELRQRLRAREVSCAEVARELLAAVGDDPLRAWARVDGTALLARAASLDALASAQRDALPLLGVPVGIKDNFDTVDLVTEYGSPVYAGHRPAADAAVVSRLRDAGALIAGKLKCAEFAWMTPPDTLNPLDTTRTPGGSSNGSAAAVAAGTVPLATGTQTAGSVNRPASYCGVVGFKPTFATIPREGTKLMAPSLDTVGLFAGSVADLRELFAVLGGAAAGGSVASPPRLAWAATECWDAVEPDAAAATRAWLDAARGAGVAIDSIELPGYAALARAQEAIQRYESARSLAPELASSASRLSDALRAALRGGAAIPPTEYEDHRDTASRLRPALVAALAGYDGVLTPSATGVPPVGLAFTGDPLFCRVWTLAGAPSLSLPLVWTAGLPVGLQLVGAPGADAEVLRAGEWLTRRCGGSTRPGTAR